GFYLAMRNPARIVLTHFRKIGAKPVGPVGNLPAFGRWPTGPTGFVRKSSVLMELPEQPGAGEGPAALGRGPRDAEHAGGLFQAATREEAELDDLRLLRVQGFQPLEGLIEGQEVNRIAHRGFSQFGRVDTLQPAAPLLGVAAAGLFDEDAAHGLGGG